MVVVVLVVVLVITVWLVWLRPGGSTSIAPDDVTQDLFGQLTPAETSDTSVQQLANADNDGDGLINSDELAWGTDPDVADTDGDGYLDGEEIAAGHDPTIPAPNDLLSDTGRTPAAAQVPALPVDLDRYLADDLDFSGGDVNLTLAFEDQYATELRSPATMNEFALSQSVITLVPRPDKDEDPGEGVADSAAVLLNYLTVADNERALANADLYRQAQYELQEQNNPATMQSLALLVKLYADDLRQVTVPAAAVKVQRLLLGYTEALVVTFNRIALWSSDPVTSMVATRQLEVLDRTYYPLIRAEFDRLRVLQKVSGQSGG